MGKFLSPFGINIEIPKGLKSSFCLGIIPFGNDNGPLTGVGSSCKALMNEEEYNILLKLEWEL